MLLALAAAYSVIELLRAQRALGRARDSLLAAEADVRQSELERGRQRMVSAERDIASATAILHSNPVVNAVGVLPVVSQNLHSLRRSVSIVFEMADGGRRILDTAKVLEGPTGRVEVSLQKGTVPLSTVVSLRDQLSDFAFSLPSKATAPSRLLLIPNVASLQDRVFQEAARRRQEFSGIAGALDLLAELGGANGPRHYLIAVANAAEMRGAGGMILSYGVLSAADGKFNLDHFGSIDEIPLPKAAAVNPMPDFVNRFAEFGPTQQWRNATLGLDFSKAAPLMAAMYQTATGKAIDGVVQVDSMGLAALLRGIGPVVVPELGQVTAENAVALTLNQAYTQFPDRNVRREYLGQVAEAAFRQLLSGDFPSLRGLGTALADAAKRRNVMVWSAHPDGQHSAAQLGADGQVPDANNVVALTVQNLTGNKLDYYVASQLALDGRRPAGAVGDLKARITLANTAPGNGRPPYIFGPVTPKFVAGQYEGMVSLYVPVGASLKGSSGLDRPDTLRTTAEDGRTVLTFRTTLQAGQSRVFTLDLAFPPRPPGAASLTLVPTPRVRPTVAVVDVDDGQGRLRYQGPVETVVEVRRSATG